MKKILLFITGLCLVFQGFSQTNVPQALNFAATALNADNEPVINTTISIQISIRDLTPDGEALYTETHSTTTNSQGVFAISIGEGTPAEGEDFTDVEWDSDPKFFGVGIDLTGGNNFQLLGTPRVLSVPYALVADVVIEDQDDQTLSVEGTNLNIRDGNSVDLSFIQDGVNDADSDSTNELQPISSVLEIGNDANLSQIKNLSDPTEIQDAATKNYVDTQINLGTGNLIREDANNNTFFIGSGAGINNIGSSNLGIGSLALINNTFGFANTAIGVALVRNTEGRSNVAVGDNASVGNTIGNNNTAIGANAMTVNEQGSNNTALGTGAGFSNLGSGNVFLGYQSGENEVGSNKFYLANSNTENPLIYGEFDNQLLRINGMLNINNSFSLPTSDGLQNQMLTTDGAGNTFWTDANSGVNETTQLLSIFIGTETATNNEASNNIGIGAFALNANTFGDGNIALGVSNLSNNTEGRFNTAIGNNSMFLNTTGSQNTGVGEGTLINNSTGEFNVAVGVRALQLNQTGQRNTAIGVSAGSEILGSGNVVIGYNAGFNETGSNRLYLSNSSTDFPLIYGEFDNNLLRINGTLNVADKVNFNQVLNLAPLNGEPTEPVAGDIYFDASLGRHRGFDGTQWNNLY